MENQYLDVDLQQDTPQYIGYASFLRRFVAAFIDGLILSVIDGILELALGANGNALAGFLMGSDIAEFFTTVNDTIYQALSFATAWLYSAYFLSSDKQATLGKQALRIVVVGTNGQQLTFSQATIRHFATYLSAFILGIGYFMQLFTDRRQTLHDMLAGSVVYKQD